MKLKKVLLGVFLTTTGFNYLISQSSDGDFSETIQGKGTIYNAIQVTLPFLTIAPDSRSGSLGDAGVATEPDINSQHWNSSKYAFMESNSGIALSYTPWLRNLVREINLAYLVGYKKLPNNQIISGSLRYFSLGSIILTNNFGVTEGEFSPSEFAIDVGYTRLFSENIAAGLVFRFIRSDLSGGQFIAGTTKSKAAISFAADFNTYYQKEIDISDKTGEIAFGVNISNMGNKVAYTDTQEKGFIPINLRLGTNFLVNLDDYNKMSFILDLNKLLVPTNPLYKDDSIIAGMDPNVSVPLGMLQSFYDAPGGFKEEIQEIMYSAGIEYWYANQFAARAGYFHEYQNKGNRKFFTVGIGLRYNIFELDFSYLVPTSGRHNPLANTVRFTIGFNFADN
ncbi:MAG: type IX secretion system outer membrane channel protein PorV [bacterium]